MKEEVGEAVEALHCKATSLVSTGSEQGSTLRDLLTTTAGKLRLGSTDAGIAFAPVYSAASQVRPLQIHTHTHTQIYTHPHSYSHDCTHKFQLNLLLICLRICLDIISLLCLLPAQTGKSGRSMPNILDDIIASVVENKIPASRGAKLALKQEPIAEEPRGPERKKPPAIPDEPPAPKLHTDTPHCWLYGQKMLWLKDHRNSGNWKLFRECWKQGQVGAVDVQNITHTHTHTHRMS